MIFLYSTISNYIILIILFILGILLFIYSGKIICGGAFNPIKLQESDYKKLQNLIPCKRLKFDHSQTLPAFNKLPSIQPHGVIVLGMPGAGKSSVIKYTKEYWIRYPLNTYLDIDPDAIRLLDEGYRERLYGTWAEKNKSIQQLSSCKETTIQLPTGNADPNKKSFDERIRGCTDADGHTACARASGGIGDEIFDRAIIGRKNIIWDQTLWPGKTDKDTYNSIKKLHNANYYITIIYIKLSLDILVNRSINRSKEEGRLATEDYIRSTGKRFEDMPQFLKDVQEIPQITFQYLEFDNDVQKGTAPKLIQNEKYL